MSDSTAIKGQAQQQLAVSAVAAQTPRLEAGKYDLWSDLDIYIKVVSTDDLVADVTVDDGYVIYAGNVVPISTDQGDKIEAIAGGAGILHYHRVI